MIFSVNKNSLHTHDRWERNHPKEISLDQIKYSFKLQYVFYYAYIYFSFSDSAVVLLLWPEFFVLVDAQLI